MTNPIVQQISSELDNLQKELGHFKSTVEYLTGAKAIVKEAVNSVNLAGNNFDEKVKELNNTHAAFIKLSDSVSALLNKIDGVNFPDRLDRIENTVKETISFLNETRMATLDELQKASKIIAESDFDGRFKNLQSSIDISVKSNTELADSIRVLNLPDHTGKLVATISSMLTAIKSVEGRMEGIENDFRERLKDLADKQSHGLSSFQNIIQKNITSAFDSIGQEIKLNVNNQKTNTYITWALIVLGVIVIIFIKFIKQFISI